MTINRFLFWLSFSVLLWQCKSSTALSNEAPESARLAFYNVENLFDTLDHPLYIDEEFTPEGKKQWTSERYHNKLAQIAKVIDGMSAPDLIGLCEVENRTVLEDLAQQPAIKDRNYEIIHFDSPDARGIDVAFLYAKKVFKLEYAFPLPVQIPDSIEKDYTTRDILVVHGIYRKKYPLYIFVNHWPSRRGGLAASEPKRVVAAQQLRAAIDRVFADDEAAIIIMGDMNDETNNKSITEVLQSYNFDASLQPTQLYNCFSGIDAQEMGSYNYRGNWNMLDQIIVSSMLRDPKGLHVEQPTVFREDWMLFQHDRFGATPNRTYGGPNYYGGISDHLPVYVDLRW